MNKELEKDLIDLLGEETFEETFEEALEELFTEMAGISLYKYYKDKEIKDKGEKKMILNKTLVGWSY